MHFADAIAASDLDGGEPEPMDVCIECGREIPVGGLRCAACEAQHDDTTPE